MMDINKIYCGDCLDIMNDIDDESAKIEYAKKIVFKDSFAEIEYDGSMRVNSVYLPRGTI